MKRRFQVLADEDSDPMLSSVNLVDVFMVAMVMMALAVLSNPANPYSREDLTIIRNPGKANMELTIKQGDRLTRFRASGSSTEGNGVKAGTAYQLADGTMVYVPTNGEATNVGNGQGDGP